MNYGLKEVMPSPPERQHHKTVAELIRPASGFDLSVNSPLSTPDAWHEELNFSTALADKGLKRLAIYQKFSKLTEQEWPGPGSLVKS